MRAAVALASAGAFFLLHFVLELRFQHAAWDFYVRLRGPGLARQVIGSIWPDLLTAMAVFLGIELSGLALAARGRTGTFWIPAFVWVLTPAFVGNVSLIGRTPAPLGPGWIYPMAVSMRIPHIGIAIWVGTMADLGLALLPAAIAVRSGSWQAEQSRPVEPILHVAALGLCLFVLWLVLSTRANSFDARFPWAEVPTMLPLFLFGLLLGTPKSAWPWLWTAAAVPILLMTSWPEVIMYSGVPIVTTLAQSLPWVGVTLLGVAPEPIGRMLQALRDRRILLLATVNALNVADAVLTLVEVHHGGVVESNPVINAIGLPAKILLVGAFSVLLARRRPRALVWPALVLLGVLGWHVAELYLNAHMS